MKTKTRIIGLILLMAIMVTAMGLGVSLSVSAVTSKGDINVWFIAGQSNAVGDGSFEGNYAADKKYFEDDSRFESGFTDVLYWKGPSATEFSNVKLPSKPENKFGAEVGIASAAAQMGGKHAVIKLAVGSTSLFPNTSAPIAKTAGTWTSPSWMSSYYSNDTVVKGYNKSNLDTSATIIDSETYQGEKRIGNLYRAFINLTVKPALQKLKDDGYTPVLRGMLWLQGEADTYTAGISSNMSATTTTYENLLTCFINDVRKDITALGYDATYMPFVFGKIQLRTDVGKDESNYPYISYVQKAQSNVDESTSLRNVYMMDPYDCKVMGSTPLQKDQWHYRAPALRWIGEEFVKIITKTNTTETPYDTIPVEYSDKELYPFAVFKDGKFFKAAKNLNQNNDTGAFYNAKDAGDGAVIYLRKNHESTGKFSNLAYINGAVTLDLGGFTLSKKSGEANGALFYADAKISGTNYATKLTVKNGNLTPGGGANYGAVIDFNSYYNTADDTYGTQTKTINVVFEDISFRATQNNKPLITSLSASTAPGKKAVMNLELNNCKFDMNGKTGVTFVEENDTTNALNLNINPLIRGGNITASSADAFEIFNADPDTASKLTLEKLGDSYLSLTLPSSATAPTNVFENDVDGRLVYVKGSTASNKITYKLLPEKLANYTFSYNITLNQSFTYTALAQKSSIKAIRLNGLSLDLNTLETEMVEEVECYKFTNVVCAKDAFDDINVSVIFDNGTILDLTMNLVSYAENTVGTDTAEYDKVIKNAVSFVKAYYDYIEKDTTALNDRITAILGADYNTNNKPALAENAAAIMSNGSIRGVIINLGDMPSIRFYIKGFATQFTFMNGDVTLKTKSGTDNLGKYIDVYTGFSGLTDEITITNGFGSSLVSGSFNYKAYSDYVSSNETLNQNAALVAVVERLAAYAESAKANSEQ